MADDSDRKENNDTPVDSSPIKPVLARRKKWVIAGIIVVVVLFGASLVRRYYFGTRSDGTPTKPSIVTFIPRKKDPVIPKEANILNGELVDKANATRYPLAVVVENHPDARPQYGLSKASIIYEAITEGGITRYLAIFGPHSADRIGPIRSARTFFVDWASEYRAYFTHAGGNMDALQLIPSSPIYNEDLLGAASYAKRIPHDGVASEHTLYSDTESLYKLAQDRKYPSSATLNQFTYKDDVTSTERATSTQKSITIKFSSESYTVTWTYDPETNMYLRSLAGKPHIDKSTNEQLKTKVFVVQTVAMRQTLTDINETSYIFSDTGSGPVAIYQDGIKVDGKWKKSSQKERTRFYDSADKEIVFNRGTMWIEVVPPGTDVSQTSITTTPTPTPTAQ